MRRDLLVPSRFPMRSGSLPGTLLLLLISAALGAAPLIQEEPEGGEKSGAKKVAKKNGGAPEKGKAEELKKATKDSPQGTGTATSPKVTRKPSIDEEYVRANLEKHLSPTKMDWLPDGRVKLMFDFTAKKEEHTDIFTPKVSKSTQSTFRWSLPSEYAGWWGRTTVDDLSTYSGALRISQDGNAHIDAWFTDDIEAEMWFANGTSTTTRQTIALVYSSGTKSIGSNWGTQAATFQAGKIRSAKGTVENAAMDTNVKVKLVVRNGTFEAYRDGKLRQSDKYTAKNFASGKLGFIWSGNVAGFVYKLEVTGRLDAKKMAELLRKNTRS